MVDYSEFELGNPCRNDLDLEGRRSAENKGGESEMGLPEQWPSMGLQMYC